ncbi:MAG: alpha/beta hydrolase [Deltaproteobacteria bacterium]|nr:alpha/beta hydrolase [Deltaproteobacteria bacterium]
MTPTSRRVRGMGIELRVLEWPSGREEESRGDVVLLHGFMDAAWSWDLVAPALVHEGFRVIAPDLRGFGESDRVPAGGYYYFPDYIFDLAELVDALGLAKLALVGHSMGGNVATMYAGLYPDRIVKLALLEGLGPPSFGHELIIERELAWIEGVRRIHAKPEKALTYDEVVRRLSSNHPGVPDDVLRRRAEQLTRPLGDGTYGWAFDPLHRTRSPVAFSVDRWRAHARRVTAPVLCVGGGTTGFHPEDEQERVASFANVRTAEISDAGHMMHWTRPAEVARLLVEHLGLERPDGHGVL